MNNPKYCSRCGCYVPDLWDSCPACGTKEKSDVLQRIKRGEGLPPQNPFGNLNPAEIPVKISKPSYKQMLSVPYDVVDYAERVGNLKQFGPYGKKHIALNKLIDMGYSPSKRNIEEIGNMIEEIVLEKKQRSLIHNPFGDEFDDLYMT